MAESRMRQFKNKGRDDSALRRRRQEQNVELRKTKRLEALSKRRHVDVVEDGTPDDEAPAATSSGYGAGLVAGNSGNPLLGGEMSLPPSKQQGIDEALTCLHARVEVSAAMEKIRRLVASTDTINYIIQSGLLKEVVAVSVASEDNAVLSEFSWILTNVTSGTAVQTEAVVELGCVPVLVTLLQHQTLSIQHQSLWALGNIAGNSSAHRDLIAASGVIQYVAHRLEHGVPLVKQNMWERKIVLLIPWVLSNLCRFNNPSPSVELASIILPLLLKVLINEQAVFSQTEMRDCCWGLSYLTDGFPDVDGVDALKELVCFQFGLVPLVAGIVQKVPINNVSIIVPCVRCLGNLSSGTDAQTMTVINAGVFELVKRLITKDVDRLVVKEAVWMISNCISSSVAVVKMVAEAGLMGPLFELMLTSTFVVQRECAWAIRNFAAVGAPDVTHFFIRAGAVSVIQYMLAYQDNQVVTCGLEALHHMLRGAGELLDDVLLVVEEAGILDKLELLQCSENAGVADESFAITDEYFASEENPNLQSLAPTSSGGEFTFNAPALPGNNFQI